MKHILLALLLICVTTSLGHAKTNEGWLGVTVKEMTPSMRDDHELGNRFGLLITRVVHDSPADDANLKRDDVILKYNTTTVEKTADFSKLVKETEPGNTVELLVVRDGTERKISVEMGERSKPKNFTIKLHDGENFFIHESPPRLGVKVHELNDDLAAYFDVGAGEGVLISEVLPDTPADKAGFKAGDVITRMNDTAVNAPADVVEFVHDYEDEAEITIRYIRKGQSKELKVKLEQPDDLQRYKLHKQLLGDDFQWNIELDEIEEGYEDHDVMILKKFITDGKSI